MLWGGLNQENPQTSFNVAGWVVKNSASQYEKLVDKELVLLIRAELAPDAKSLTTFSIKEYDICCFLLFKANIP